LTSEENIETVRNAHAAFNEGGPEAGMRFVDPAAVFEEPPEQPGAGVFADRDSGTAAFGAWEQTWESHRSEWKQARPLDQERVFLETIEHFQGRAGIEVSQPSWMIFTFRDGKIVRFQPFWSEEKALAASTAGD
jgi:ketosteroid isomerase-like protein